ncbi:MAG TPA: cytochrome c peroxidase [Gemmatimonadales bacterium]|nr:cytochrome c peroxidase [Gemmatimonadales bacterium]
MQARPVLVAVVAAALAAGAGLAAPADRWSEEERATIASMSLSALEPIPADPSNRYADDPRAAALGQRLFFDTRLSGNGRVACATCHDPKREFQDGTPLARGVGTTDRRTMPVAAGAWSEWMFWDGRKDSQWSQALGPLESPVEHGGTRAQYVHVLARHYRREYEATFGRLPNLTGVPLRAGPVADPLARGAWDALPAARRDSVTRAFANIGKAIAAYERRIRYGRSRFDRFADELARTGRTPDGVLSRDEIAGLRLFIGKAGCITCHNGPLLTDQHFHNTGVPQAAGLPADPGRERGAKAVLADEFNCRSPYSDAPAGACAHLEFLDAANPEMRRAFKTPSLRNVAERGPYMHAGQLATLEAVVEHYDRAPAAPRGRSELLRPLGLTVRERAQLVAFLGTLSAPLSTPAAPLAPPD